MMLPQWHLDTLPCDPLLVLPCTAAVSHVLPVHTCCPVFCVAMYSCCIPCVVIPPSSWLLHPGLAGAWIGLTVQHCGNHGAMSTSPLVNKAMGLTDDLIGGSSLMWRYHHQVRTTRPILAACMQTAHRLVMRHATICVVAAKQRVAWCVNTCPVLRRRNFDHLKA